MGVAFLCLSPGGGRSHRSGGWKKKRIEVINLSPEIIGFLSSSCTGLVAIIVCVINNRFQNAKTIALLDLRLKTLEEKVDKHNNLVERTYQLEQNTALQEEKIKVANHRIDDLERGKES